MRVVFKHAEDARRRLMDRFAGADRGGADTHAVAIHVGSRLRYAHDNYESGPPGERSGCQVGIVEVTGVVRSVDCRALGAKGPGQGV